MTSINTNHLACMRKVGIKGRDSIKGGRGNKNGDREKRKKHCSILELNL